ncbi:MAG: NAD-dependent DNA ligase LigA [Bacteroidota bacterium]
MYTQPEQKQFYGLSKDYLDEKSPLHQEPAEQKAAALRKLLIYHEWRYYILNDPVLGDTEYDFLYKQLEAIEEAQPELITPDSPTQRVSPDLTSDFESVEHLTPMLSLANSYNAEDLMDWDAQIKRLLSIEADVPIVYTVEPKFDGGSIALVYENDQLVRAATRGNGRLGEEITNNARAIRSIPLSAKFSKHNIHRVELRGEVLIRKDIFEKMNKQREKEGSSLFANARNTATGGLRMKDPKEVAKRGLEAFLYTLGYAVDQEGNNQLDQFDSHHASIDMLDALGFKVPTTEKKLCKNIQEVINFCKSWEEKRDNYEYEIDGMVVKVNDRTYQERAGSTAHHPRWAIAYKFKAKQATSKLRDVAYQVGKIGSITPVAKLDPVQLAGVTVSSVSLHNEDFITSKDLHYDDTVLVERAGDVIPYIVKAIPELRDGSEKPIVFPKNCPMPQDGQEIELVREEGEAAWRCPTCVCGQQDLQRMIFHVSKSAMDIDGLGKSIVERFFELGWLKRIEDVYKIDYDKVEELEGFGKKSVDKLKASIEKAKKNPIQRLLHSLSIHHLGKKASKLLAAEIEHVLDLKDWELEKFTDIKDVGPVVAENVMAYFQNEDNIRMLEEMERLGVNMKPTDEDRPTVVGDDAPLAGKTILFTGTLQQLSRKEAQQMAEQAGAKNISAVSSNLNILVVGEKAGSKLKKAEALGSVEILSEDEFLSLIKK